MNDEPPVSTYYSRGDLLERLSRALVEDGVDPLHPSLEALAPYDQFHGRGLEATEELAAALACSPADHLLDVGSGIGGPARYLARRFGCRVTGIDLTAEFCAVARTLTSRLGLQDRVAFELGDALAMPFADARFDGAYSMNVSMNIADKARLYREVHRVLKPGAWLVLSEIAQGGGGELDYPTPWAASSSSSFLATPEQTRQGLVDAGFEVVEMRGTLEAARAFGARSRAMVQRGEKPAHRAVMLIYGEAATRAIANLGLGFKTGSVVPIEVRARKAPATNAAG